MYIMRYMYVRVCWELCTCACVVGTEVSTRMVSEYKSKLQIAESENTRLDGTVSTLQCMYAFIYM